MDACQIYRVSYAQADVTDKLDLQQLALVLSGYRCSRLPIPFRSYAQSDVVLEIDMLIQGQPMHLLLGNLNIVYRSSGSGAYKIRNSQTLLYEVGNLLNSTGLQ